MSIDLGAGTGQCLLGIDSVEVVEGTVLSSRRGHGYLVLRCLVLLLG